MAALREPQTRGLEVEGVRLHTLPESQTRGVQPHLDEVTSWCPATRADC